VGAWSSLNGSVTFHKNDKISIRDVFINTVDSECGCECIFSYTEPVRKFNEVLTTYFTISMHCDIDKLNDILRAVDATIRRKYLKYYRMSISIQTRFTA